MVVANYDLSSKILPRVIIVSRRTLRKNKYVDFVGEYHLDLIVSYGAVPVIVPRVNGIQSMLQSFEPIHGVLLCEGEDVDPSLYADEEFSGLSSEEMEEIRKAHVDDMTIDKEKDSIELTLARFCLERNIPYLGICRGSQILNVAAGGTLYQDIDTQVVTKSRTKHIDYDNYDGHRHGARIVAETPMHKWFQEVEIMVNSYHHQGVKKLAQRFVPMAYAPDGVIEGFYDPNRYDPEEGQFLMGLQFHPERMRLLGSDEFDYPGCALVYEEFVKAVVAFQKKQVNVAQMKIKKKAATLVKSFSQTDLVETNTVLSKQQENRLKQMGATVRNSFLYMKKMKRKEEQERAMDKMSNEQLSELLSFHHMMARLCSDAIKRKLLEPTERTTESFSFSNF